MLKIQRNQAKDPENQTTSKWQEINPIKLIPRPGHVIVHKATTHRRHPTPTPKSTHPTIIHHARTTTHHRARATHHGPWTAHHRTIIAHVIIVVNGLITHIKAPSIEGVGPELDGRAPIPPAVLAAVIIELRHRNWVVVEAASLGSAPPLADAVADDAAYDGEDDD